MDRVPKDARKEIKEANKVIANAALSKLTTKTGYMEDKTILNDKRNEQFDSYLVGTTSYNVADAVGQASKVAAKRNETDRTNLMIVACIIEIIVLLFFGQIVGAIFVLSSMVMKLIEKTIKPEYVVYLNLILSLGSLRSMITTLLIISLQLVTKTTPTNYWIKMVICVIANHV